MQPACKPDSVPDLFSAKELKSGFHHFSGHDITTVIVRPTPRHRTSSPKSRYTWSRNPQGVRHPVSPPDPVSSYLTFSPLSRHVMSGWLFSATLLYPHGYLPVRKYGALCCPDFPFRKTRALRERNDGTAGCTAKVANKPQ